MTVRALIVDDEPLARARIADLLLPWGQVQVVGECANGTDAVQAILEHRPGLIFLDIQMPGLDGFDVLEAVSTEHLPAVIFVTAFSDFAIRAFDVHAIDYLLKPVQADRFGLALERALASLDAGAGQVGALVESISEQRSDRLIARSGARWIRLSFGKVEWVKAAGNYLRLGTEQGECLVRGTLGWFLERAPTGHFLQVHRSILVHVERVASLESRGNGSYEVRMCSGFSCHSSRSFGDAVRRLKSS